MLEKRKEKRKKKERKKKDALYNRHYLLVLIMNFPRITEGC